MNNPKSKDAKAITHHLPQADHCPTNLQATIISEDTIQSHLLLLSTTLDSTEHPSGQPRPALLAVSSP